MRSFRACANPWKLAQVIIAFDEWRICNSDRAGLTTALLLSQKPDYKIVVAAKHMPGDYDIAGANYMP